MAERWLLDVVCFSLANSDLTNSVCSWDSVTTFLISTASSIVAMVAAFAVMRWRWPTLLGHISASSLFKHGVAYGFPSQREAASKMCASLRASKTVRVLCMRGYSMSEPDRPFRFLLADRSKDVRLLIADPGDKCSDNPEILRRAKLFPQPMTAEKYRQSIIGSLETIAGAINENSNLKCHLHRLPASFRAYISDDRIYLSFFGREKNGPDLPIVEITQASALYDGMVSFFDAIWENHSRDCSELRCS